MRPNRFLKSIYTSSNQRSQLIKKNVIIGFGVRGISIISSLLLVPLCIHYINSELYGIWLTLSSIIHWIGFFDIGFGNGLRNKLGESIALGKYKKGRIYVSTTYALLFGIFFFVGVILYFIFGWINWASFLNVSQDYNPLLIKISQILLVAFCVQMTLKVIQNVIQANQWNALASLLDALGNVLSLVMIYFITITMAPDMTWIAIAFSISPIIILSITSLLFYLGKYKKVSPHIGYVKISFAKDIFQLGSEFFIIQIATVVLYQLINILISRLCGPEQVTNYNVCYKYLSVLLMIVTIIVSPMWSAFTDAYTKKDYSWMKSIYKKMIVMCIYIVIFMLLMILLSPYVYYYWIGSAINISIQTTFLVGIYILILIWGMIHSYIINGIGKIFLQLCYSVVAMLVFVPLAILLGHYFSINGILCAIIIINLPGVFINYYQVNKLLNNTSSGIWNR